MTGGELRLRLRHAPDADAAGLADRLRAALDELTAHARATTIYQPSDFPLADLDDEGLAAFLGRFTAEDREGDRS